MKKRNLSLALMALFVVGSLEANEYYDNKGQYNCDIEGPYDEEVDTDECCRRPLIKGSRSINEQDPTEELEQDTAWPSQNEEFSDQLFTPNGGPWLL